MKILIMCLFLIASICNAEELTSSKTLKSGDLVIDLTKVEEILSGNFTRPYGDKISISVESVRTRYNPFIQLVDMLLNVDPYVIYLKVNRVHEVSCNLYIDYAHEMLYFADCSSKTADFENPNSIFFDELDLPIKPKFKN